MGGSELSFINQAFEENWIAPVGPNLTGFEKDLTEYTGLRSAVVLSSGTAAIHLALILLDVKKDDEVICQSFTFSASANPIVYQGAVPVFVDSEPDTWNMDPELLENAIKDRIQKGKKPQAVVLVHLYGMPAMIKEIKAVCDRYEVVMIEDSAEALGAKYEGRHVGSYGLMNILSFNGNKIITTSGGGALLSDDEDLITKARFLSQQARDPAPHYQHSHIGYNYRMSNIIAGIGRGQMQVVDKRIAKRRENFDRYVKFFNRYEGINFVKESENSFSNRWLTTITIDEEKQKGISPELMRLKLEGDNIESRPLWKPMHLQPVFKDAPAYVNGVSESLFNSGLCLPSGSGLSDNDFNRIFNILEKTFK